ncbi:MAG: alpha/beta hydrolase-fold protein [Pseudomonadota bacterium]|nr:alpha/beta hydrolase-fold protein [Pseudomonadota bacterium]
MSGRGLTRRGLLAGAMVAGSSGRLWGQPVQTVEGATVMETGTDRFHVAELKLPFTHPDATGPLADYRIRIAWPKGPTPDRGFPAVHVLDGRAAAASLTAAEMDALADMGSIAIVAHGHDNVDRFSTTERVLAYTPPAPDGGPVTDPRGRIGGGADGYLGMLTGTILPRVEALAPLDPSRRTLWGHSFAGLFVLQAALFRQAPFARFVAASPSLWWDHATYFQRCLDRLRDGYEMPPVLDLHAGSAERARASRPENPNAQLLVQMREALPEGAFDDLATAVRAAGLHGETEVFDGLSHGETFARSLRVTLEAAARAA